MTSPPEVGFLYVTRLPPSPSGVALYASVFAEVLETLGDVTVVRLPAAPTSSQSLWCGVRLARELRHVTQFRPDSILVVEIAGRGVAEFWAAWAVSRSRGRRVWLTVHDAPALSGGAFFTAWLDRRGGRRLAAALSGTLGAAAERGLLARADRVLCLSNRGARALEQHYRLSRHVDHVPHVAHPTTSAARGRREILVPGYVGSERDFLPLIRLLPALPVEWTLVVGACSAEAKRRALTEAYCAQVADRVRMLGFCTEEEIQAAFDRAAVVARWRRDGWVASPGSPGSFAVSGPLISAMGNGCAIVTNDNRGLAESFADAGVMTVADGDTGEQEMVDAVRRLVFDEHDRVERGETGRRHAQQVHSVLAVADVVRGFV